MFEKLRAILNAHKINERLEEEISELKGEVAHLDSKNKDYFTTVSSLNGRNYFLENKKPKIKDLLQLVFDGKLEWYDYRDLKPELQQQYHDQAQHILRTDIFNNEMNFLKSNWSRQAIKEAHEVKDPESHVLKLSWMLLGIELFKLRLEEVPTLEQPEPTKKDLNANV